MPTSLRNVLAVTAGIIIGSIINSGIITLGPTLVPPPAGLDVTTSEGLAVGIHLFEPRHFIPPFLGHALGTLVGALVAYLLAATRKAGMAYVVGVFYLCGGIAASIMIPAPAWFIALDLVAAYIPMAWLATVIGSRMQGGDASLHREAPMQEGRA